MYAYVCLRTEPWWALRPGQKTMLYPRNQKVSKGGFQDSDHISLPNKLNSGDDQQGKELPPS